NVVAMDAAKDSTLTGAATDIEGTFRLLIGPGTYRIRVSFVGFTPSERTLIVDADSIDLGRIELTPDPRLLDEIVVEELQDRVTLRGDTTVFHADAFKVTPDANAEDLVIKMPGIIVQDGSIQAEGEDVRRVLVDGEEFFGDDPSAALKNLPAEIIKDIEV